MLCLFVTNKHVNFVGDVPSPSHSHKPRPRDTGVTRLRTNIGKRGARAEGGINKIEGGEGVECCVVLSLKNTSILLVTRRVLHTHKNPASVTRASRAFGRTLGEGAHVRRGGINKIRPWGGQFPSGHGQKGKISWPRASGDARFYVKINPRQKSGDAVACA